MFDDDEISSVEKITKIEVEGDEESEETVVNKTESNDEVGGDDTAENQEDKE